MALLQISCNNELINENDVLNSPIVARMHYDIREVAQDKNLTPNDLLYSAYMATAYNEISWDVFDKNEKEKYKAIAYNLIKFAIDCGANVNLRNNRIDEDYPLGRKLLDYRHDSQEIIELLLNKSAKCSFQLPPNSIHNYNASFVIEQKFKNINATKSDYAKIPYILHHIWLTSSLKPREISEADLQITFKNKNIYDQAPVKWQHIVWTNDKKLIPISSTKLEDKGIIVQSIYDCQSNLKLFDLIEYLVTKSMWGLASDTLRYSLIENFGGVYSDLNYKFYRDITDETHKYNLLTTNDGCGNIHVNLLAASPHHQVLQKSLQIVENNLQICNIDENEALNGRAYTIEKTASAIFKAYIGEANKNGNIDVVYKGNNNQFISVDNNHRLGIYDNISCPEKFRLANFYNEINKFCNPPIDPVGEDTYGAISWSE